MASSVSRSSNPLNTSKLTKGQAARKFVHEIKQPLIKTAANAATENFGGRDDVAAKNAKESENNSKSSAIGYVRSSKAVQMVVEAERRYNNCVNEARKRRKDLLKRAVFEATDELRQLRERMDDAHIERLEKLSLEEKAMAENIGAEIERDLKEMREKFLTNRAKVLKLLIDAVENIDPHPHRNLMLRRKMEKRVE